MQAELKRGSSAALEQDARKGTQGQFLGMDWKFWLAVVIVFAVIQVIFMRGLVTDYIQTIVQAACVMAIVALGLNLIYGFTGQFSLGQWGFYAIGAYASAEITYTLAYRITTPINLGFATIDPSQTVVFLVAILFGAVLSAAISFLFGLPVLKMGGDYFGIATLGFTLVVKVLAVNSDQVFPEMKGARGMVGIPHLTTWLWAFLFLVLAVVLMRNLIHSTVGRAMVSVREDEVAAKAMGIDTVKYKTLAFVIGSFYAGLAGGLYAHLYAFLHPSTFDFLKSFDIWIIVVFGGVGSITGTVIATFGWAALLEGLRIVLPSGFETWRFVIYPVLLLLVMLLRPQGLFGGMEIGFLKAPKWPRRQKSAVTEN
jgi:branched-chain amino acid transport system permease protein